MMNELNVEALPLSWNLQTSPSIANLAKALPALQLSIPNPTRVKDSNYGKYADLSEILRVIKEPLEAHGFSMPGFPALIGEKSASLSTILLHESGEFLLGHASCPLPPSDLLILKKDGLDVAFHKEQFELGYVLSKNAKYRMLDGGISSEMNIPIQNNFSPMRAWGSVVTYLRRTSICCLLNLSQDDADDDGYMGDEPPTRQAPVREVTEEERTQAIAAIKNAATMEALTAAYHHAKSLSPQEGWHDMVKGLASKRKQDLGGAAAA